MADQDQRKLTQKSKKLEDYEDVEGELLHDGYGDQYLVNSDFVEKQKELRTPSEEKEQELIIARELLSSNLRHLTSKQRDVLFYTMQGLTQGQIGDKLQISQASVAQHLKAVRKKLQKLIEGRKEIYKEIKNGDNTID